MLAIQFLAPPLLTFKVDKVWMYNLEVLKLNWDLVKNTKSNNTLYPNQSGLNEFNEYIYD